MVATGTDNEGSHALRHTDDLNILTEIKRVEQ